MSDLAVAIAGFVCRRIARVGPPSENRGGGEDEDVHQEYDTPNICEKPSITVIGRRVGHDAVERPRHRNPQYDAKRPAHEIDPPGNLHARLGYRPLFTSRRQPTREH